MVKIKEKKRNLKKDIIVIKVSIFYTDIIDIGLNPSFSLTENNKMTENTLVLAFKYN